MARADNSTTVPSSHSMERMGNSSLLPRLTKEWAALPDIAKKANCAESIIVVELARAIRQGLAETKLGTISGRESTWYRSKK